MRRDKTLARPENVVNNKSVSLRRTVFPVFLALSMTAAAFDPVMLNGGDAAKISVSVTNGELKIDYSVAGIDAPNHAVYVAIRTGDSHGSYIVPYGAGLEGSTVFLPFSANYLAFVKTSVAGDEHHLRTWNKTMWSERYEATGEFGAEIGKDRCTITFSLAELGDPKKLAIAVYAKDLRQNQGWGRFFGCSDATVTAGIGDKCITGGFEIDPAGTPPMTYRTRFAGSRVRIYQLFVRLFGNTKEKPAPNGTIEQNGVGKFADINDAAIDSLAAMGFTHIWLTGVLQQGTATDYSSIGQPADDPDLLKGLAGSPYAIRDYYDVCPDYAEKPAERLGEFKALLQRIHSRGLKALIDFVPNHVARSYDSDVMPAENFGAHGRGGSGDDTTKFFDPQNNFFYLSGPGPLRLPTCKDGVAISPTCKVLEGKCDGLFDGERTFGRVTGNNVASWTPSLGDWYETVKLNYGFDFTHPEVREYPHGAKTDLPIPDTWKKMDAILAYWQAAGVDGFRCDMSHMEPPEFWHWVIERARSRNPDVYFVGEAYNNDPAKVPGGDPLLASLDGGRGNVMFDLLNAGFNAVYDDPTYKALKKIYDGPGWANDIDAAVGHEFIFHNSLRYAENHDEVRLAAKSQWGRLGMAVGRPVSAIIAGLGRGPILIYNGQEVGEPADGAEGFGGEDARTSIFDYWSMPALLKWVNGHRYDGGGLSKAQKELREFYTRLLHVVDEPAFRDGAVYCLNSANRNQARFGNIEGDPASGHWMYAFLRHDGRGSRFLVVVNLHPAATFENVQLRIPQEALDFLGLDAGQKVKWTERLSAGDPLTLNLAPRDFAIPKMPPLTPCFFEIEPDE